MFHLAASLTLTGMVALLPVAVTMGALGTLAALALALEAARLAVPAANRWFVRWFGVLLKAAEARQPTGATYLVWAALLALLLFGREATALAVAFVAVGDPLAALVGQRVRGPRVGRKSLAGTAAFVAGALAAGAVLAAVGAVAWRPAIAAGAVAAALLELAPLPVDDNLTIPLGAGAALALLGVSG